MRSRVPRVKILLSSRYDFGDELDRFLGSSYEIDLQSIDVEKDIEAYITGSILRLKEEGDIRFNDSELSSIVKEKVLSRANCMCV